jgi:hypothetical protein
MSQPVAAPTHQMPVIKIGKVVLPQKKMNIGQPQFAPAISQAKLPAIPKAAKVFKPVPVVAAPAPPPPPPPAPVVAPKKERKKTEKKELTTKQKLVALLKSMGETVSGKSLNTLEEIYSQKYPAFFISLGLDPTKATNLQSKDLIEGFDASLDGGEVPGGVEAEEELPPILSKTDSWISSLTKEQIILWPLEASIMVSADSITKSGTGT